MEIVLKIASSPDVAVNPDMARKCFDHYSASSWVDGHGNAVGRTVNALKSLLRKWKVREPSFSKGPGTTPSTTPSAPRSKDYNELAQDAARDLWEHRDESTDYKRVFRTWLDKTRDIPKVNGLSVMDEAISILKLKRQAIKRTP